MTIKYAYCHPETREYLYVETREELQNVLANNAAQIYVSHYCNGEPYTIVETDDNGMEKWYTPTGEQRMTAQDIEMNIKSIQSFRDAGQIPVSIT
jgi:hypothetical protein